MKFRNCAKEQFLPILYFCAIIKPCTPSPRYLDVLTDTLLSLFKIYFQHHHTKLKKSHSGDKNEDEPLLKKIYSRMLSPSNCVDIIPVAFDHYCEDLPASSCPNLSMVELHIGSEEGD
jgi:hypothetical protein